jgi:hypothetical protein
MDSISTVMAQAKFIRTSYDANYFDLAKGVLALDTLRDGKLKHKSTNKKNITKNGKITFSCFLPI